MHRPGHGNEEEQNGKAKVTQPWPTAGNENPQDRHRYRNKGKRPTQQTPIGICFGDKSNRKEKERAKNDERGWQNA
jgi:hypothetical protein